MTREDAYPIVRPFLWCPTDQDGYGYPEKRGRFKWSPTKPTSQFGNPYFRWDHPTFDLYMRVYSAMDKKRIEDLPPLEGDR